MNFRKLLTYLTVGTAAVIPFAGAQNPTILQGSYISNVFGNSNFVLNPNAQTNIANVTNATRSISTPLVATSEFTLNLTSGTFATWTLRAFDGGMKGQNCEARFTYRGFATATTKAEIVQNSLVVASLTLTPTTDPRIASINFPCGDLVNATTFRIAQTTANMTGTNEIGGIYVGLATNMANVAQAENVVQASRTGSQSFTTADTAIIFNTETKDAYGEFDTANGRFTAKRAGDYLVSSTWLSDLVSWTSGNFLQLALNKNTAAFCRSYNAIEQTQTMNRGITTTCVISLAVGDYIESRITQNQATMNSEPSAGYVFTSISRFPSSSELVVTPERQNVFGGVVYTGQSQSLFNTVAAGSTRSRYDASTWNQPTLLKGKAAVSTTNSGNTLGFSIPNLPVGKYKVEISGLINAGNQSSTTAGSYTWCNFFIKETTLGVDVAKQSHQDQSYSTGTQDETRDYTNNFSGVFDNTSVGTRDFILEAMKFADNSTGNLGVCQVYSNTSASSYNTNITFLLTPLDQPSNSALYVQGPVKAAETGAAIPAGYVGQKITGAGSNLTPADITWTSFANTGALPAGVYQCFGYMEVEPNNGSFTTGRLALSTANNNGPNYISIIPPVTGSYRTGSTTSSLQFTSTGSTTVYANVFFQTPTGATKPSVVGSSSGIECTRLN